MILINQSAFYLKTVKSTVLKVYIATFIRHMEDNIDSTIFAVREFVSQKEILSMSLLNWLRERIVRTFRVNTFYNTAPL